MAESITCPKCGRTSYHPEDVRQRYCGACHRFHDDMLEESARKVGMTIKRDTQGPPLSWEEPPPDPARAALLFERRRQERTRE